MKKIDIVETFISRFKFNYKKELEYIFTSGNCYYFAVILKDRFNGEIYYLPIENHFISKINNKYYDITGEIGFNEVPYKWDIYKEFDRKQYEIITRDCIRFDTRKVS